MTGKGRTVRLGWLILAAIALLVLWRQRSGIGVSVRNEPMPPLLVSMADWIPLAVRALRLKIGAIGPYTSPTTAHSTRMMGNGGRNAMIVIATPRVMTAISMVVRRLTNLASTA